ncbi:transposase [Saccharothrix sp. S26]|uniref:IS110 family transposase n=1 Tax=Saccharothrix sp. S26 TaxID=2907215 RepID=UPI0035ABFCDC
MWLRPANYQAAIEQLVARAAGTATEVRLVVGLTGHAATLSVAVLVAAGQRVVHVPGRAVNLMSGAFRGEVKTDARVIAETTRMHTDLSPVTASDDLVVELARLTGHREDHGHRRGGHQPVPDTATAPHHRVAARHRSSPRGRARRGHRR